MIALARLAVAHPRRVLGVWLSVIGVLALIGVGVDKHLNRSSLEVPGTGSSKAGELRDERFGESADLVVLLEGPRAAADRQGRRLTRALERDRAVKAIGPWTPGAGDTLRPKPGKALVLVRISKPFNEVSQKVVPHVRKEVERSVSPPVESHVTGYADVAAGIHGNTVEAVGRAEKIAAPLLMIVLFLVFRGPIAASLPMVVGFTTIGASQGVLEIVNAWSPLDAVALNMISMMGLALGVDYALLLVSRFREELAAGADPARATLTAVETAGRTVVFAGLALAGAMGAAFFVAPGDLLGSATLGVVIAVLLSLFVGLTGLPAMLTLLGPRVDKWSFGRTGDSRFGGLALRALRRPAVAAGLVLLLLAVLSSPALALAPGPPDPRVLPAETPERADFEAVQDTVGAGWSAPFEVVVAARKGTATDPRRLAALDRWQRRVASRHDVQAVVGAGDIARRTRRLDEVPRQLDRADAQLRRGLRDQARLEEGLQLAGEGVEQFRDGLARAAEGAGLLEAGGDRAALGASALRDGLTQARTGGSRLRAGLAEAGQGAGALADGTRRARRGTGRLVDGVSTARKELRKGLPRVRELASGLEQGSSDLERLREPAQIASRELAKAKDSLDRMLATSKADPEYARLYEAVATAQGAVTGRHPLTGQQVQAGYDGLDASLARAVDGSRRAADGVRQLLGGLQELDRGLGRLHDGATELHDGARRLDDGARELLDGLDRLERGGGALTGGLGRLEGGGGELAGGVRRLGGGAGELETALADGASRTGDLRAGIGRMEQGVADGRARTAQMGDGIRQFRQVEPALGSGHFVLAALDSARPAVRKGSGFLVNLDRGGSAARIVVIGKGLVTAPEHRLRPALEKDAKRLEKDAGVEARVGGPATTLQDFDSETSSRLWLLVAALAGVTYLVLVPVLRSLLAPLLAVVLNLFTVAAALGLLAVLFQGDAPLGGPGYLDAIMVSAIVSVVFGLSIDYEVFLLARMREGWSLTGSAEEAISYGLRHTAGVVTGAAMIMTGVFVAFAVSEIVSMRQLGIGLTVAVLLDATLVRLVLLPAVMRLVGPAAWWIPGWLGRLLDSFGSTPEPSDGAGPAAAGPAHG